MNKRILLKMGNLGVVVLMLALTIALTAADGSPTGLLVDMHRSPAMGVSKMPMVSWVVPHVDAPDCSATDQVQVGHQVGEAEGWLMLHSRSVDRL